MKRLTKKQKFYLLLIRDFIITLILSLVLNIFIEKLNNIIRLGFIYENKLSILVLFYLIFTLHLVFQDLKKLSNHGKVQKNNPWKGLFFYSNLSASIGLSFAALYAGNSQNTTQIHKENQKLTNIEDVEITAAIENFVKI